MDAESIEQGVSAGGEPHWPSRVDWRSGKVAYLRDDAFWQAHERKRVEQGLSIAKYCQAQGLALSTYRHRLRHERDALGRGRRAGARSGAPAAAAQPPRDACFVPVAAAHPAARSTAASSAEVEVRTPEGLVIHLAGTAAQQLLQRLMGAMP